MSKRVGWDYIAKKYPDKWAFITNVHRKDSVIIDCTLLKVVSFEDISKVAWELRDQKMIFEYVRTTESHISSGVIL